MIGRERKRKSGDGGLAGRAKGREKADLVGHVLLGSPGLSALELLLEGALGRGGGRDFLEDHGVVRTLEGLLGLAGLLLLKGGLLVGDAQGLSVVHGLARG